MDIRGIIEQLERIAPPEYAAGWDNVGLLVGSPDWQATSALLTIDLTDAVLAEAADAAAGLIVAYHPPIFEPLTAITDGTPCGRVVLGAARRDIAVYSPHTALDAAPDGVNDWLARGLGKGDLRALETHASLPASEECKLVTFCPAEAAERVRNALATVGAGRIGDYELCSFEIEGTGTFHGGAETQPAVGRRGHLERVAEIRLEMVCPEASLALAVATLRQFHPYEEPPIEIYRLQARPQRGTGAGRKLVLDQKLTLGELVARAKKHLGVDQVRVATGHGAPRRYRTLGLCPGAGGALRPAATAAGCELFLTGEMRHHDVLRAQAEGCTVLLAGHTNTERGFLRVLRQRLDRALPDLTVSVSRRDADPMKVM
jgi:dinuclear metal center YbgI/SA1388 family protein